MFSSRFSPLGLIVIGLATCLASIPHTWALILAPILLALTIIGLIDLVQERHSVRRNYPIIGRLRWAFEKIRPEIRQYLIESDDDETPFSRAQRSLVYARAKNEISDRPFGTLTDVYKNGYEFISHSTNPKPLADPKTFRLVIGGDGARDPYTASIFNISAMSFGSLSANAIRALNKGARLGGFAHDTGEGGISPYHRENGGDLIWEIGSGYFGCRRADGRFDPVRFAEQASTQQVKMVELKLSQGAKPGHGGIAARATKGTEALLEWPSSLEKIAARAINNRKSERHLWSRLKSAANNHQNLEIRDLVVSGAPVIAEGLREAVAPDSPPVMLQTELVRLTGISAEQGAFLSKGDFLRSPDMVGDAGSSKLDRALCEEFIEQRKASERNETVATRLLLPTYAIMQMGCSDRLDRPSNPGLNALEPQTRIMAASVERLVAELASLDVSDGTEELLSIGAASRIIGGGLKPWDEIMYAVLNAHLPCLRAKGDRAPTTRSLLIRRKDVGMLAKTTRGPKGDFNVPLFASQQDAMEILNATSSQMTRLRSNGMLNFEQAYKKLACPMNEVLALAERRIFSVELSLRTGIAPHALKAWCDAMGIVKQPEGGYCRVQFERLQSV